VAADNNVKKVNAGDKKGRRFFGNGVDVEDDPADRETPLPTSESAFGTTTSLEGLAAWTERTDDALEWLPFRL